MQSHNTFSAPPKGRTIFALSVLFLWVAFATLRAQVPASSFQLQQQPLIEGYRYVSIEHAAPLTTAERNQLTAQGIDIVGYRRGHYELRVPAQVTATQLTDLTGGSRQQATRTQLPARLAAQSHAGEAIVWFRMGLSAATRTQLLSKAGIAATQQVQLDDHVVRLTLTLEQAQLLAASPIVAQIIPVEDDLQPLNYEVNVLQNAAAIRRLHGLSGQGVVVGIGDGGELGDHLDLDGRILATATGVKPGYQQHADHVSGTVAGRGILNPKHMGIAPDAELVVQKTQNIIYQTPTFYNQYGMRVTNNSYGPAFECANGGAYNTSSSFIDMYARTYPEVLHVFAAGNAGTLSCSGAGYPSGYFNILEGYQSSKNVLTVGLVNTNKQVRPSSSKGPVVDGRLKPEIVGVGQNVTSMGDNNNYWTTTGTSMATPAVSGTAALLIERYHDVHGSYPASDLLKNILCNTAEDIEQPGPDFRSGFGLIDARRAVDVIDQGQFYTNSISHGALQAQTITVPAGTHEVKVMLYYHDYQGTYGNTGAQLINDLDITLTSPDGTVYQPWVLDATPANVAAAAQRGTDNLNNIEQVTIAAPAAGTYTVTIAGTSVVMGPQAYTVSYDLVGEGLALVSPNGGQRVVPGDKLPVTWQAHTGASGKFMLEYSADGGATWTTIASNISATKNYYNWTVPADLASTTVSVRVSRGANSDVSDAPFTVLGQVANLTATPICEGYVELAWDSVAHADSYTVYWYDGQHMQPIAEAATHSYTVQQRLPLGEVQWLAVAATLSGKEGRRSVAQSVTPSDAAPCTWADDVQLVSIDVRDAGRKATSTALTATEDLTVTLKNSGTNTLTSVPLKVEVAGTVYDVVADVSILPNQTVTHTIPQALDLSAAGHYDLDVWTALPGDAYNLRDSLAQPTLVRHIDNQPYLVDLPTEFYSPDTTKLYEVSVFGLPELQRADYFAQGGQLLLLPEVSDLGYMRLENDGTDCVQELVLTYNFAHMSGQELSTAIQYRGGGLEDYLYVRGNDQDDWVLLGNLSATTDWTIDSTYNLSQSLASAGQSLSAATQLMIEKRSTGQFDVSWVEFSATQTALPVELLSWEAERIDERTVALAWATSMEANVRYFEVEVSTDGETFEVVDTHLPMGSEAAYTAYTLNDTEAYDDTYRYYRLVTHFDGGEAADVSDIVVVAPGSVEATSLEVSLAPNPVSNGQVRINTPQQGTKTITLVTMAGRVLETLTTDDTATDLILPTDIAAGIYLVRVEQGHTTSTTKLIVQ